MSLGGCGGGVTPAHHLLAQNTSEKRKMLRAASDERRGQRDPPHSGTLSSRTSHVLISRFPIRTSECESLRTADAYKGLRSKRDLTSAAAAAAACSSSRRTRPLRDHEREGGVVFTPPLVASGSVDVGASQDSNPLRLKSPLRVISSRPRHIFHQSFPGEESLY